MARRELVIALLLALSASWRCVVAYPPLWLAEDEAVESCVAHPAKPEGPHGAPVKDKATTFVVTAAGSDEPVKAVCPGGKYKVALDFGSGEKSSRRVLLTSSVGNFTRATPGCGNRVVTTRTEKASSTFEDELSIPCKPNGTAAHLEVTSAWAPSAAYQQASLHLPFAKLADCPDSTCPGAAAPAKAANKTASAAAAAAEPAATAPPAEPAPASSSPAPAAPAKSSSSVAVPAILLALAACLLAALPGLW